MNESEEGFRRTRVLIVDDSPVMRRVLEGLLQKQPDIEVVGSAPDPYVARDMILDLDPDVVTLDIEMPRMNGLSFLRRLMHYRPLPVIVISSLASMEVAKEALRIGAVEVLSKHVDPKAPVDLGAELIRAVRSAVGRRGPEGTSPVAESGALIVIGASTGGVEAIQHVLGPLPAHCPPILVVQHIPRGFSAGLAQQLSQISRLTVREAGPIEVLQPGLALIAPGDRHMEVRRVDQRFQAFLSDGAPVNHHRPSVDVLFHSAAKMDARNIVAVLLTGMGGDGAKGLLELRKRGATTIAQDEKTSVVYGMPGEAARLGAAQNILPLPDIAAAILKAVRSIEPRPVPA